MPSKAALQEISRIETLESKFLSEERMKHLIFHAKARLNKMLALTTVFDVRAEGMLSRFDENEINLGKILGTGSFCSVFEIKSLDLSSGKSSQIDIQNEKSSDKGHQSRDFMSMACIRDGEARYAVKKLSDKALTDESLFKKGCADLASESKFLAALQHRNIIRIRGLGFGEMCSEKFFIVLDRLYDTLEVTISKWRKQNMKYSGFLASFTRGREKAEELFIERIQIAWDISTALQYIHNKKIIYRDLKPENVGFDIRGCVKMFDFGVAKQLMNPDGNGNYKLTPYCGSPMYMSPEVIQGEPYNESADIYSFGIMFWEIMALEIPYERKKISLKSLLKLVVEKDYRPSVDKGWPQSVKRMIFTAWHADPSKRKSISKVKIELENCVIAAGGDEPEFALDTSTKSFIHFMEKANRVT